MVCWSVIMPDALILILILGMEREDWSFLFVPKAVNVRRREASAFSPPLFNGDALIADIGFSLNSPVETVQSSAFFSVPGTPYAYSGVQIITPFAVDISCLKILIASFSSSPGLKGGI